MLCIKKCYRTNSYILNCHLAPEFFVLLYMDKDIFTTINWCIKIHQNPANVVLETQNVPLGTIPDSLLKMCPPRSETKLSPYVPTTFPNNVTPFL